MVEKPLKLAVVHWSPVELYPPVMNLVRVLSKSGDWTIRLHTTSDHFRRRPFATAGCRIVRNPTPTGRGSVWRAFCYLWFQLATLWRLLIHRPNAILYIEPSSSFPVFLYSLLHPGVPVFIHHHEYHSSDQFLRPGMRLIRWFHRWERQRLFPRACWVSHTNAARLNLFCGDCPEVRLEARKVLPNYPPGLWREIPNNAWRESGTPFRFVYAGSASLKDTFLAEFVRWVIHQPKGVVEFDIYAYNLDVETRCFLESIDAAGVRFFLEGVDYDSLPTVLRNYHAGVILYRAATLNYRFNETNKLFEYLACGLDVWYSDRMEGIHAHRRTNSFPRVIECDFSNMNNRDWRPYFVRRADLPAAAPAADAESAVLVLNAALKNECRRKGGH